MGVLLVWPRPARVPCPLERNAAAKPDMPHAVPARLLQSAPGRAGRGGRV